MSNAICVIPKCDRASRKKGMCNLHYLRVARHGSPNPPIRPAGLTLEESFDHYMPGSPPEPDTCWIWSGSIEVRGYGTVTAQKRTIKAHRLSYEIYVGEIPAGLIIRHTCDVRNCVQPAHLIPGTDSDNAADRDSRGRHIVLIGESHGMSKVTADQVRKIREERIAGETMRSIATRYGITRQNVRMIVARKTWKHVD